jgi:hypothetical protein
MTDLLSRGTSRPSTTPSGTTAPRTGRPLALGALLVGVGAPAVALSLLWFVGLIGWYADDGGSHGTTRSVLRVGADAWLLAHGSSLTMNQVVISASPLGLTLLCGYLTYRLARRAGAASDVDGLRAVGLGTVVLSGSYAAVALLTAVLAGSPTAEPGMGAAFLGGAVVGGLFGGAGLLRGAGRAGELRRHIPVPALSIGYAAVSIVLLVAALGALLTAIGLVFHWSAAVEVVDQLRLDLTGGLLSLVLLAAIAPNVVLLAASYLLGSGFAFGVGTVVSPGQVELGPVPSLPILAALPDNGWSPGWAVALMALPVLAAAVAAFLTGRALPTSSYQSAAGRGLGAGVAGAVLLTLAAASAGGSIGPGRMSSVGVSFGETLMAAVLALGCGAVLGAVPACWWTRRQGVPDARHPDRLPVPPRVKPLAGPDDITEPVHLPPVSPDDLDRIVPQPRRPGPSPADLASEETVQIRLPKGGADGGAEDRADGKGGKGSTAR